METAVEAEAGNQQITTGTNNPSTGTNGDLFYNTGNNTTYVYEGSSWHRVVPTPNLANYSVIQALQAADVDATTARQNLQNAITTLENYPQKDLHLG